LRPAAGWGLKRWHYTLGGGALAVAVVAALLALSSSAKHTATTGGAKASATTTARGAHASSATSNTPAGAASAGGSGHARSGAAGGSGTGYATGIHAGSASVGAGGQSATGATAAAPARGRVAVAEVRDPEEAKSFPLPASVHHRSASTPSVAGEAAVAAGAASDAQIRKELGEEQHAEAQARAAQQRVLTPAAGGFSVGGNGTIPIPSNAPEAVQRVIAGGNAIADFPYIWGGGHASFVANGYDCSGSVSYALAAGGLLSAPLVSGDLANWGEPGPGRWITIYANAGHTFMVVDGMWFDTAGRSGPYASRWLVSQPSLAGYAVRHPPGL
jgi:cell wall-associated NlpC family hydrolase